MVQAPSGPTALAAPSGIELVAVRSAEEMAGAVAARVGPATIVIMAAAVADYRPATVSPTKIKKTDGPATLEMVRTTDILRSLGQTKGERLLVGFAAETEHTLEQARKKLREKNLDLIVANDVSREGAGFGGETNAAVLIGRDGGEVEVSLRSKRAVADAIWDRVMAIRKGMAAPSATAR